MPFGTQSEYLRQKGDRESWDNIVGVVTKVFEHDGTEEQISNHEASVQMVNRDEEFKRMPIHTDHNGSIYVPKKGDMVEVGFLKSKTQRPYVANVVYTEEVRAPLAKAGHFRREFGPDDGSDYLYFEAEPTDHSAGTPETVRMAKKSDGLSDPSAGIELDDSGSDPTMSLFDDTLSVSVDSGAQTASIEADPDDDGSSEIDLGVDASGSEAFMRVDTGSGTVEMRVDQSSGTIDVLTEGGTVKIGDRNGSFKKVARKGDNVEVTDEEGRTHSGSITSGSSNVEST